MMAIRREVKFEENSSFCYVLCCYVLHYEGKAILAHLKWHRALPLDHLMCFLICWAVCRHDDVMFFITREQFAITFALLRFNFSFSSNLHQLCGCRVFWTPEIQMVLPSITFSQGNVTSCLSPTAECCTVATRKLLSAAPYQKELPQLVALRMLSLTPPQ